MTDPFARAWLLYNQNRNDLAEQECRRVLETRPDDAEGYLLLSLCLSSRGDASSLDAAKQAVALAPERATAHYALARAWIVRNNLEQAEAAINRAIELESWVSGFYGMLSAIKLAQNDWVAALNAADIGLSLNAEDETCLNNRATALMKLGRSEEANRTLEGGLENNPESPYFHTNQGWALLHQNRPNEAVVHFREALRLNPSSDYAREGLLTALRARNWFYRRLLQFFLWMSRFSPRVQIGLLVGLLVMVQFLGQIGEQYPALMPLILLVIVGYVLFAAASWFSNHLMNAALMLSRDGRILLTPAQKRLAVLNTFAVCLVVGLVAWGIADESSGGIPIAIFLFLFGIHLNSALQIPAGQFRWMGLAASAVVMAFGVHVTYHRVIVDRLRPGLIRQAERFDSFGTQPPRGASEQQLLEWTSSLSDHARNEWSKLMMMLNEVKSHREAIAETQNFYQFGSLAVLLLHAYLMVKSRQHGISFE